MLTIDFLGESVQIELVDTIYTDNGRRAIQVVCHEGPFGMLTVNLPEADLADDEVCVKVWSENASWAPQVLAALKDRFIPTGRSVRTGFVEAPVYRVAS